MKKPSDTKLRLLVAGLALLVLGTGAARSETPDAPFLHGTLTRDQFVHGK